MRALRVCVRLEGGDDSGGDDAGADSTLTTDADGDGASAFADAPAAAGAALLRAVRRVDLVDLLLIVTAGYKPCKAWPHDHSAAKNCLLAGCLQLAARILIHVS